MLELNDLTDQAHREELGRVLASKVFAGSPRLARLLKHLVEKSAAGDRESLKEYSIGLDVFGRDPSFDPKADSIVRSTARQLRLKLAEYYQYEGRDDRFRLQLPKGSYVIEIEETPAMIQVDPPAPEPAAVKRSPLAPTPRSTWIAAAAVLILTAALAIGLRLTVFRPAARLRTVAVLPFTDLSPDHKLGYLGESLQQEVTSALVGTKGIQVMACASAQQLGDLVANPAKAGEAARSETVVTGSIAPSANTPADKLDIIVNLVDVGSGKYLWSQTYRADIAGMGGIEHNAAQSVADALGISAAVPAPRLPRNAVALELYLRASALSRTRNPEEMRQAAPLFERALALEPDFAPAYAAAASNYLVAVSNGVMNWASAGPRGMELARKALELDPSLADAHAALGLGWDSQFRWNEAAAEFSRAIQLDPRYPAGYFRKAVDLVATRHFPEAERTIEMARVLDPSWTAPDGLLGELYYYSHRFDDALALARRTHDKPGAAYFADELSARVYLAQGKFDMARPFVAPYAASEAVKRAWLLAIDGNPRGGLETLLTLQRSSGYPSAYLAMYEMFALNDRAAALDRLEQSFRDHEPDVVSLNLDPLFDPIRADPRARALLREMNLSP